MNILLVDDELLAIQYLSGLIEWEKHGYHLAAIAHSAAEAKEILTREPIDIVIFDVYMPEENGVSLSAHIASNYPHIGMLALSSYDTYDYVRQILRNGAYDYILKHRITAAQLLSTLQAIEATLVTTHQILAPGIVTTTTIEPQESEGERHQLALSLEQQRKVLSLIDEHDCRGFTEAVKEIFVSEGVRSQVSRFMICKEILDFLGAWATKFGLTADGEAVMSQLADTIGEADGEGIALLLGNYFASLLGEHSQAQVSPYVQQALLYVNRFYAKKITLERCAKSIGVNASYLSRIFHAEMGLTFSRHLSQVRITCAKIKILHGTPLKQVASECGFKNYNYFFKVFKDLEGITPLGYMEQEFSKKK
jgi:YesN/AraC family two-component response regulator